MEYVLHDVYETIEKAVILMMPLFCSFSGGTEAMFTLLGSLVTFVGILLNARITLADQPLIQLSTKLFQNGGIIWVLDEIHQFMGILSCVKKKL